MSGERSSLIPIQLTGTIDIKEHAHNKQVLDKLKVERERGITGTQLLYAQCRQQI